MDLVAIAAVQLRLDIVSRRGEPVGGLIDAFAPGADGVLVTGDVVKRQFLRDFFGPLGALDALHHLAEIQHGAVVGGFGERVEGVGRVVVLDILRMADPLVAEFDVFFDAVEHEAEEEVGGVRVGFVALAVIDELLDVGGGVLQRRECAAGAAHGGARQFITIGGDVVTGDEGTHTVAEQEVRETRIHVFDDAGKGVFVFAHGLIAFGAPVSPAVVDDGGLAVADMVIGGDDVARVHERDDHVEIAAGMLAKAVDELDDALRLAGRHIDPSLDHLFLVIGLETDFV